MYGYDTSCITNTPTKRKQIIRREIIKTSSEDRVESIWDVILKWKTANVLTLNIDLDKQNSAKLQDVCINSWSYVDGKIVQINFTLISINW